MASSKSVAGLLRNLSITATPASTPTQSNMTLRRSARCLSSSASSSNSASSSSKYVSHSSTSSAPSTSSSSKQLVKTIPLSSPLLDKPLPMHFPSSTLRSFPSLLHFADPILDPHPDNVIRSIPTTTTPYPATTTFLNEPRIFRPTPPSADSLVLSSGSDADEVNSEQYLSTVTPLSVKEVRDLHRHAIVLKRVVHMTTKGKDASMYALIVAGNGNGLVGYGEGKDTNASKAGRKAFHEAVKNLDSVSVHKGSDGSRTIETQVEAKWGASRVVMRPRPAGFGLRVPPVIHAICRSVGITDLSASIYGSTNPVNVVKAALQILWGGAAPLGMGDGLAGEMRRKDKGRGMRSKLDIERSRGRRIAEVNMSK
ncbi:related to MRPS5 - mitochondrial ribosomal protein, small subunit [Melanopsichium pennsylvanicum]|uniref:Small ribosomal subunit protein uS5m n=2 Tax=Melanopsichium pennsylvanicum TaxID=63383 RepID=A0AAJ4XL21_9BASI|nr:related to MRPS5-mitochondrial ribosomal protein, small subunit [Melanopsichium pennsylvanicum 4]SNX84262.1 related to MRPS5 - mitochondrial ribosomal protein, small subunit [Melanopsichium pennsylvanicum]